MALKTFVAGEALTAADTNVHLKNSIAARKTATESVTSSITLQDDDNLTVSVAADSVYEMQAVIKYDAGTTGDLKCRWVGPSGATLSVATVRLDTTAAVALNYNDINTDILLGGSGAGSTLTSMMQGLLVVSTTAGTFKLQWAQNTSDATATRLFADSYVCLRRID